jgi:hypothetical protein
MPQRRVLFGSVSALAIFGLGALSVVGCSGSGAGTTGTSSPGTAGTGTAGAAGTPAGGAAGDTSGGAGNPSGAAGDGSGAAGTTSGVAGSSGLAGVSGGAAGAGASGSGAAGTPGTGAGGATGAAGSGGRPSGPSAGCNADVPPDLPQKAVEHDLVVTVAAKYMPAYVNRKFYTQLPTGWDPTHPYPMIFYGEGCGQTGAEGAPDYSGHFQTDVVFIQLIPASVTGATVVPSDGSPGCFQAGKQGGADSPDGPYFDAALAAVEKEYCVDQGKVYVAGTSSGAWLANYLACARGNVITGTAADSGGLQHDHGTCTGGAAVMEMQGDSASIQVGGFEIGSAAARDTFVATNGAGTTPTNVTFAGKGFQVYSGGTAPVAWYPNAGGHQSGSPFMLDVGWAFWTAPR